MSTMTWEKIRDHHLGKVAYYTDENYPRAIQRHQAMADFITAHLAQPAQAVDVVAILELACQFKNDEFGVDEFQEKLTRSLSGEKAGPAGDEADAQWTANVEIPTVARLYYTGIGSRRYKRASVQSGAGEPLCFVSTARELLRRQRAALLPASPAPDKENL